MPCPAFEFSSSLAADLLRNLDRGAALVEPRLDEIHGVVVAEAVPDPVARQDLQARDDCNTATLSIDGKEQTSGGRALRFCRNACGL